MAAIDDHTPSPGEDAAEAKDSDGEEAGEQIEDGRGGVRFGHAEID